jgi:ABC-2 type transport system permease protein
MGRLEDSSLVQLTLMRIREFLREPEALFWTFLFPVLLALGLGVAFREGDPQPHRAAVVEAAGATELAAAIAAGGINAAVLPADSAAALLRRGQVAVVVVPGPDGLVYRYDPTRPESRAASLAVDDIVQRSAGRADPVDARVEEVRARGARYIDWLIPGLIGLNLLSTGLWGVGFTIVSMRRDRLMKRFMASPMRRAEFLGSFFFGRLLFLGAELAVLLLFAWMAFGVQVQGSLAALVAIAVVGAFSFTALGLLVASRATTTEGVSGLMNAASFPMWVLSGVFFSYHAFPDALHPFIRSLPLTAFNDATRAVMNDGLPLVATLGPLAVLVAWGVASFLLALAIFRWQ